jgi:hypothetical protein
MEIKKYVVFKGEKLPMVNTPLLKAEMMELRDKYPKFLIHDIKKKKIKVVSEGSFYTRHNLDIGWKPVAGGIIGLYVVYNLYLAKRNVKKLGKPIIDFKKQANEIYKSNIGKWQMPEENKKVGVEVKA